MIKLFIHVQVSWALNRKLAAQWAEVFGVHPLWATQSARVAALYQVSIKSSYDAQMRA